MEKQFKLLLPKMPNTISLEAKEKAPSLLSDSMNTISIKELSESEAIEYGEAMKQAFIKHWQKKTASE